jgi:hypothetical protein
MNDILIRIAESAHGCLAIFDYDGTLVKAREGRPFPKDVDDWTYLRASVPAVLRALAVDHQIVIVTDQSKGVESRTDSSSGCGLGLCEYCCHWIQNSEA